MDEERLDPTKMWVDLVCVDSNYGYIYYHNRAIMLQEKKGLLNMMNISRYDMMVLFNAIYLASFGNITNTIDLRLAECKDV